MKLSHYSQGRDNNFNLIRVVAALAVLVGHSFPLAIGHGAAEPLGSLGMTVGSIAVDVFFITSGFLVTASLLTRQSTIEFVWARVLRIFPALLVMLFLTVFVLGASFTSLPVLTYFSSPETYIYLTKSATLIKGVGHTLPGVFDSNPYKSAVNGSLWTMTYEVRMYALLAIIWLALRVTPGLRLTAFRIAIVALALAAGVYVLARHFYFPSTSHTARLFFMFFVGAAFYVARERVVLSGWLSGLFVATLLLATINNDLFFVVYMLAIAYVSLYLAYIPSGHVRKYNRLGDYSYGIYIYAFPVQQSIAALIPGVSVAQMIWLSLVVTFLLAALSWHLLEKRALSLKAHYIGRTRKFAPRSRASGD